jgi:hypothetical protein
MAFEKESAVYKAHRTDWLEHEGKYLVIRGEEITGPYETLDDALEGGYQKYALEPFMVKQIHKFEPIYYFSRDLPPCQP